MKKNKQGKRTALILLLTEFRAEYPVRGGGRSRHHLPIYSLGRQWFHRDAVPIHFDRTTGNKLLFLHLRNVLLLFFVHGGLCAGRR